MRSFRSKPIGWRYESHRHSLAAHGVKTKSERAADILSRPDFKVSDVLPSSPFEKREKRVVEDAGEDGLSGEVADQMRRTYSVKWRDKMHGGLGDDLTPFDVTPDQMREGVAVEMEHTNDKHVATEIFLDHYAEFGAAYYPALKKMEEKLKRKATESEKRELQRKFKHHKYTAKKEPSPDFDRELKSLGQQIAFNRNARENLVSRKSALQSKVASDPSVKYEIDRLTARVEEIDEIDRELGEERSLLRERKFESQKPPWER